MRIALGSPAATAGPGWNGGMGVRAYLDRKGTL